MRKVFLICAVLISFIFISCSSDSSSPTEPGIEGNGFAKEYFEYDYFDDICEADDGGCLVLAYREGQQYPLNIVKLDTDGLTKKVKEIETINHDLVLLKEISSNRYAVAYTDNEFPSWEQIFRIIIFDSELNQISDYSYKFGEIESFDSEEFDFIPTSDGNFLFAGYCGGEDCFLVKLDDKGNTLWTNKVLENNNFWASNHKVIENSNKEYVYFAETSHDDCRSYLAKISESGNLIWEYKSDDSFSSFAQSCDNGYTLIGKTEDYICAFKKINEDGSLGLCYPIQLGFHYDYKIIPSNENDGYILSAKDYGEPSKIYKVNESGGILWKLDGCDDDEVIRKAGSYGYLFSGSKNDNAFAMRFFNNGLFAQ